MKRRLRCAAVALHKSLATPVLPGSPFRAARAVALIASWPYNRSIPVRGYDVLADGSFIAATSGDSAAIPDRTRYRVSEMHVVLNFAGEFKARVK